MGKGTKKSSKRATPDEEKEMEAADVEHPQPAIEEEPPAKQPKTAHGGEGKKASKVAVAADEGLAAEESKNGQEEEGKKSTKTLATDLSGVVANAPRMKTSLCSYFRKGSCRHGDACRYAHGEAELKPRPDGTWDPTSDIAKSLARDAAAAAPAPKAVKLIAPTSAPEEGAEEDGGETTIKKCILPVQQRWSGEDFKKFLTDSKIEFVTAKKRKGDRTAFVSFQDEDQLAKAIKIFDGIKEGGRKIQVRDVLPRAWERSNENVSAADDVMADADNDEVMEGPKPGVTTRVKNVCDAVTPLAHLTYEEQLNLKREDITQILKRLARNTRKGLPAGVLMPDWMVAARDNGGLPCPLEGVLSSPDVDGYRNKCEFSIGCAVDGTRAVGFQLGSFREGILAVAEPTDCKNVSSISRSYAVIFQKFVQISELPVWNKTNNKGFWRMLTVREGRGAAGETSGVASPITEVMLIVQVCPIGVEEEIRSTEYKKMADHLSQAASSALPPLPLTALLVQDHTGVSNAAPSNAPLHALTIPGVQRPVDYIHTHMSNLKFRISPTAFFQVNTLAAERLYSLAGDWAELTKDTLLFDVCCGTGTIGLTLAHRVGMVVGIEMNESAVADAKKNAELNNITNCRFIASKAEDVMESLLKEYATSSEDSSSEEEDESSENETETEEKKSDKKGFKNIVAIVDPPRVGLHPIVLKTLRLHSPLRRLVYISCNPQSLLANAVELCTPLSRENSTETGKGQGRGNWRGLSNVGLARNRIKKMPPSTPFSPKKAMAVDLFPHTSHCEMVMLFER